MILTIESISGGDEGEREVVDILAIEGGESGSGPDQRLWRGQSKETLENRK